MGTSQSSKGSPGNVPMVPPWVPDPVQPEPNAPDAAQTPSPDDPIVPPPQSAPVPIAPMRRFTSATRRLGQFMSTGGQASMRQGLGEYVRHGYGGASTATRRLGGTVATARSLYNALGGLTGAAPSGGSPLDRATLSGRSVDEVMDAIVEAVRPTRGDQDTEASRASIKEALVELLTQFPDANLLDLTDAQRLAAIESYIALDVYKRVALDVGAKIQAKAPNAKTAMSRFKEIRAYIKEVIAAEFRQLRAAGQTIRSNNVAQIVQAGLREVLGVFESYAT